MAMTWDLTDVPAVDATDLGAAMRSLIENGRGLVLLRGLSDADLDTAQAALQRRFHGEPQRALAAFVRFRHMVAYDHGRIFDPRGHVYDYTRTTCEAHHFYTRCAWRIDPIGERIHE